MQIFNFHKDILRQITQHAILEYPSECCGWIMQSSSKHQTYTPSENLQDKYHKLDPNAYPRTSKDAFLMNVLKLNRSVEEGKSKNQELYSIVHSHIEVGAYFSEEDVKQMTDAVSKQPIYNSSTYLVVNVNAKKEVDQFAIFYFSKEENTFLKGEVNIIQ